ncbi:hypothetical protein MMPV_000013 [Pyropia vietnamensis]
MATPAAATAATAAATTITAPAVAVATAVLAVLDATDGPYSVIYYHGATGTLTACRDVFGRRSLAAAIAPGVGVALSSVVPPLPLLPPPPSSPRSGSRPLPDGVAPEGSVGWVELPPAGVYVVTVGGLALSAPRPVRRLTSPSVGGWGGGKAEGEVPSWLPAAWARTVDGVGGHGGDAGGGEAGGGGGNGGGGEDDCGRGEGGWDGRPDWRGAAEAARTAALAAALSAAVADRVVAAAPPSGRWLLPALPLSAGGEGEVGGCRVGGEDGGGCGHRDGGGSSDGGGSGGGSRDGGVALPPIPPAVATITQPVSVCLPSEADSRRGGSTSPTPATSPRLRPAAGVAVLFSGGVDSVLLARLSATAVAEAAAADTLPCDGSDRDPPPPPPIDLLSVAFESAAPTVPDRLAAVSAFADLVATPGGADAYRLVLIDVSAADARAAAAGVVGRLTAPAGGGRMDASLGVAGWYAARGAGVAVGLAPAAAVPAPTGEGGGGAASAAATTPAAGIAGGGFFGLGSSGGDGDGVGDGRDGVPPLVVLDDAYVSPARVLLSGLGADELAGGYKGRLASVAARAARHPDGDNQGGGEAVDAGGGGSGGSGGTARGGANGASLTAAAAIAAASAAAAVDAAVAAEMDVDLSRLWSRNGGRDDRVAADAGREVRYPYLDARVVALLASWPLRHVVGIPSPPPPSSPPPPCPVAATDDDDHHHHSRSLPSVVAWTGGKWALRRVAAAVGLPPRVAVRAKRAMQFGCRSKKALEDPLRPAVPPVTVTSHRRLE